MAADMTLDARRAFLTEGTRTAVLATAREDGRPHAAPVSRSFSMTTTSCSSPTPRR